MRCPSREGPPGSTRQCASPCNPHDSRDKPMSKIRFLHVRITKCRHGGKPFNISDASRASATGGFTFAYRDNGDGTISFGMAKCRDDEAYVKRIGREQSTPRVNTYKIKARTLDDGLAQAMIEAAGLDLLY